MNKEQRASHEQIAATIAHEIKNPLQLIKSTLQYVELSDKDRSHKKNYELMYREIDRINDIVADYMSSAAQGSLKMRKFKISRLLEDVCDMFMCELSNNGIRLEIFQAEEISIRADYDKIKQVMVNIVQNAREALGEDGYIEISAFKQEGYAHIVVKDNGCGIHKGNIEFIGRPFFTTKEKGNGLGISICRSIIKRHRGSLDITGAEGRGTRVIISLPVLQEL